MTLLHKLTNQEITKLYNMSLENYEMEDKK